MAWVERNGNRYYYLSQREGKKVRKIYVGKDNLGRAAELVVEMRKEQRKESLQWLRQAAETFDSPDASDAALAVEIAAVLFARTRIRLNCRISRRILNNYRGIIMDDLLGEEILSTEDHVSWQQLSERASRGDRDAAAALIPMLDSNPELVERWGDISRVALNRWLELMSPEKLSREAMHRQVLNLVRGLRRFEGDVLEETMARRIGLLWLQSNYFDSQVALATGRKPAEQTFLDKRQQNAQELYTDACKVLREYQKACQNR